jgi:predicted DNA-binding protein (UPF0251 family)
MSEASFETRQAGSTITRLPMPVVTKLWAVEDQAYGPDGASTVGKDPDLWMYRDRTSAMLRRYFRYSIEVGRLPSLLGREFFRTRVTSYRMGTFEDAVIFVHDVERCLDQLDEFEKTVIGKVVFQDFSHHEAAAIMGCQRRTVGRRLPEAIDHLTEIFLESGLLIPFSIDVREEEDGVKGQKRVRLSQVVVNKTNKKSSGMCHLPD